MGIDDILKVLESWRRMTDFDRLVRQMNQHRQFMEPAISELARTLEDQRRVLEPLGSDINDTLGEFRKVMGPAVTQIAGQVSQLGTILDPAMKDITQEFDQLREFVEPPFRESMMDLSRERANLNSLADQFGATKNLLSSYGDWAKQLTLEAAGIGQARSDMRQLLGLSAAPALGFVSSQFERTVHDLQQYQEFKETFASEMLGYLDEIHAAAETEDIQRALADLAALLEEKSSELPRRRLSFEGLLNLLVTFLLFALTHELDMRSERRFSDEILGVEQRIVAKLEELPLDQEPVERYLVKKGVRLRSGPSIDHEILAILTPNMTVEVKDSKGSWLFVEYFDYVEGNIRSGWVFKRYLVKKDDQ